MYNHVLIWYHKQIALTDPSLSPVSLDSRLNAIAHILTSGCERVDGSLSLFCLKGILLRPN